MLLLTFLLNLLIRKYHVIGSAIKPQLILRHHFPVRGTLRERCIIQY